jgi:hypothetical protein
MIKLYRKSQDGIHYWETWDHDSAHTIHWGVLGENGESKEIRGSLFRSATKAAQAEIDAKKAEGYREIPIEEHDVLLVEYAIDGMGTRADLAKRHRLESQMDEVLGWTGLGHCDGGSIGSGTMEVCCIVVDFEIAVKAIASALRATEFADYLRIYREEA